MSTKILEIKPSQKIWKTAVSEHEHPHVCIKQKQKSYSVAYKLPISFVSVSAIVAGGVVVYKSVDYKKTSVVGGGGRFEVRRRFYDGALVFVELLLKDMCYYTSKPPALKIFIEIDDINKGE